MTNIAHEYMFLLIPFAFFLIVGVSIICRCRRRNQLGQHPHEQDNPHMYLLPDGTLDNAAYQPQQQDQIFLHPPQPYHQQQQQQQYDMNPYDNYDQQYNLQYSYQQQSSSQERQQQQQYQDEYRQQQITSFQQRYQPPVAASNDK